MTKSLSAPASKRRRTSRFPTKTVLGGLGILALLFLGAKTIRHADKLSHQLDTIKPGPVILSESFERDDNLSQWIQDLCCDRSLERVTGPVRSGEYAARLNLARQDPIVENSKRAEIKRYGLFGAGTERWYGFSIYLPDNYESDRSFEIVAQWHSVPDFALGETWRTPPLILTTLDGNWTIHRRWDSDKVTRSTRHQEGLTGGGTETIEVGPYERGVWTDWVFQIKWAYNDQGLVKVWKNGELVADRPGPNTFRDFIMPYFKIGIYKPQWTSDPERSHLDKRTLYIDAIRVGNGKATYEDVAP